MQANVIPFSIQITFDIIVRVNQVLLVNVVKQISTIVKESFVQRTIHNVLMESIHFIVNVKKISNEVRLSTWNEKKWEENVSLIDWDGACVEQNPCDSSPCHPNSTCYNLNGGQFRCMCPPSSTGLRCDEDIDECTVFPFICRNGGTFVILDLFLIVFYYLFFMSNRF